METLITYGFGAVLLAIAAYLGWETWRYYGQYRTVAGVDPSGSPRLEPGETVTIQGEARIREPVRETARPAATAGEDWMAGTDEDRVTGADEDRSTETLENRSADTHEDRPATADGDGRDTGLLAWRIRRRKRKRRTSSGSRRRGRRYRWKTEDAGLEVGQFSVRTPGGTVAVDPDAAADLLPSGWGTADPWDSSALHLGDPDEKRRIDDPRDFGPDLPVDVDLGPLSTGERSRMEVNRIDDGDEIVVHGELVDTGDGLAITDDSERSLVLASGSIGDVIGTLRAKMAKTALIAAVLVALAAALLGGYTDGIEFSA